MRMRYLIKAVLNKCHTNVARVQMSQNVTDIILYVVISSNCIRTRIKTDVQLRKFAAVLGSVI